MPYVEWHTGPRRVVTFDLDTGRMGPLALTGVFKKRISPTISVDGRQFPVYWGQVSFEVPSDRAVHVAVTIDDGIQVASTLIPPGSDLVLAYRTDASGRASLEPIAT